MPQLQARDFPKELYDTMAWKARRKNVLLEIDNLNIKNTNKFPDPAKLTRKDRDR
jgi:hypothetical protein